MPSIIKMLTEQNAIIGEIPVLMYNGTPYMGKWIPGLKCVFNTAETDTIKWKTRYDKMDYNNGILSISLVNNNYYFDINNWKRVDNIVIIKCINKTKKKNTISNYMNNISNYMGDISLRLNDSDDAYNRLVKFLCINYTPHSDSLLQVDPK
jgi:hypothetical protein